MVMACRFDNSRCDDRASRRQLGTAKIVRAMPNTPSQIGAGITAWTCTEAIGDLERNHVRENLSGLGKELFVGTENMIDMATSLSATDPTYIFMVMEALTSAGVRLGFSAIWQRDSCRKRFSARSDLLWNRISTPPNSATWLRRQAALPPRPSTRWRRVATNCAVKSRLRGL